MITPGSSIPEILKMVRQSFSEFEFNELQEILMEREKMMNMELEDLKRDLDSMKTEARLQERSYNVAESEKLRIEEKHHESRRKCAELNEKIARLSEEHRVSCDRAKRAEERHDSVSKEFSQMISEKNKLILELKGKINELQSKNLENEKLVEQCKEQSKSLESLRDEKLAADQLVVELRRKQAETDQVVAELKRQNCEVIQSLDECRQEKMESDSRLENLAPRVKIMEIELANLLNVKVEGRRLDLPDIIKRWKDSLETESTNADAGNVGTSNSAASDDTPLVMKGSNDVVTPTPGGERGPRKVPLSSFAAREVIEICDSDDDDDDDAKSGGTKYTSDAFSGQNKRKRSLVKDLWYSSESD
ncbi:hypothetical protein ACS0TY_002160 [Phlomoides rotata]